MPLTNVQDARSLAEMWAMFRAGAIPPHVPDYQLDSMRDAFYGGAWAFSLLLTHALSRGGAEGIVKMLDTLHDEINDHTMATVRAVRISSDEAEKVLAIVKHGMPLTETEEAYIRTLLARDDDEEPPNAVQ